MNSEDYFSKLDAIVNDSSKFKKLDIGDDFDKASLIISKQRSVKYYVDKYLTDAMGFDKKLRNSLTPIGAQPGKLYGLCKVHKDGHPMRPIVSMIGTPEYELAKFLDGYIKPNIPKDFMLSSTSEFIEKLQIYHPQGNETMVSFDVSSLFTNVPLMETIDIVIDRLYGENAVVQPPIKKNTFRRMLVLCSRGMFIHNGDWYEQVDGVAMGSPLAPSLANMFLADIESRLPLNKHDSPPNYPKLYLRYVDDTFCLFECKSHYEHFLDILNSLHPNLNFTVEVASNSMPFLDVCIRIENDMFQTSVYRKSTHTNVFLNYHAVAPSAWKKGLVFCLLHRAKLICSSVSLFWEEVDKLRVMFSRNGYSYTFFDGVVERFLNPPSKSNESNTDDEDSCDSVPVSILKVPFYGKASLNFARDIVKLIKQNFNVEIRVVYTTYKVGRYFKLKSRTPSTLLTNVVYQFTCAVKAHITYVGYTACHLVTRAEEHTSTRKNTKSHVKEHILQCDGCKSADVGFNNIRVLKHYADEMDCKVGEALTIKKTQTSP